ncbi:hypothetical protein RF55_14343 [Lasius niger]|uniref:Uncharacterized protein n=1 Tax=Lasius niger TaxID=67767 RepID=A0A0J7N1V6_LASNI|nr:hypothetical protein RF55_14343 [Lasius niger]
MSELNTFTVVELKERLKSRGLPTTGTKTELIARLMEADPTNSWMAEEDERARSCDDEIETREDALRRREIEFYKREKELAERELELARREILMLREQQRRDSVNGGAEPAAVNVGGEMIPRMQPRMNLTTIGDLLSDFDGVSGDFDTWEKQVRFVKETYHLGDDYAKILIGTKLKKRAFEWFHSRPEYVSMPFEVILEKLRAMFQRRESRLTARRTFENRVWKREESFQEYLHDKIIKGNRVPVDEDELLEHIIDGIPDVALRDQARIQGFVSTDSFLKAFEKITLRDRSGAGSIRQDRRGSGSARGDRRERTEGESNGGRGDDGRGKTASGVKRCFNCGAREHISANCPTKDLGTKCFECGKYGHIAPRCPKKGEAKKTVVASVSQINCKKYMKDVSIGGRIITALVDTGSDISIMRASEYAMVGAPSLRASETEFCGVGGYRASAFGEFRTQITIDGHRHDIFIRVVPDKVLQYGLLLGADFLNTVEVNFKGGLISIIPMCEEIVDSETRPEIFAIDVLDANAIDLSGVQDAEHKRVIGDLIENYRPGKARDTDIKMTIVLKDDEPIYQRARRLSQIERDVVNAQIVEWEEQGIVRPSISDFASPVVLVKKRMDQVGFAWIIECLIKR